MDYSFQGDIDGTRKSLLELQEWLDQGAAELREAQDFQESCDSLINRLGANFRDSPPEPPEPPRCEQEITVTLQWLAGAPASGAWLRQLYRWRKARHEKRRRQERFEADTGEEPGNDELRREEKWLRMLCEKYPWLDTDKQDRQLQEYSEPRTIQLDEPRFPGSPAKTVIHRVTVDRYHRQYDEDGYYTWEKQKETVNIPVPLPAVPPDAPLTDEQRAYRDRMEEIKTEVRDITTFRADWRRRTESVVAKTARLDQQVQSLDQRVTNLPKPPETTKKLDKHIQQIRQEEAELQATREQTDECGRQLDELKRRLKDLLGEQ